MKRIKIIRNGVVTNQAELPNEEADSWLASCLAKNKFGLPERWVNGFELSEEQKLAAIETRISVGSLGEEITEYKLAAEYTIVEEDMTAEIEKQIAKDERLQALKDKHKAMKNSDLDTIVELRQAILEMQEILGLR
jgi:hypothetical protein